MLSCSCFAFKMGFTLSINECLFIHIFIHSLSAHSPLALIFHCQHSDLASGSISSYHIWYVPSHRSCPTGTWTGIHTHTRIHIRLRIQKNSVRCHDNALINGCIKAHQPDQSPSPDVTRNSDSAARAVVVTYSFVFNLIQFISYVYGNIYLIVQFASDKLN